MVKVFSSLAVATEAIPVGSLKLLDIDGKKIAITNTNDGFRAFDNQCPHQFEPLHKGKITANNQVVCRLHDYRFNLITGMEAENRCRPMNIYAVTVKDSGVFIDL